MALEDCHVRIASKLLGLVRSLDVGSTLGVSLAFRKEWVVPQIDKQPPTKNGATILPAVSPSSLVVFLLLVLLLDIPMFLFRLLVVSTSYYWFS